MFTCWSGTGSATRGRIWEAAMAASHFGLDNITVVVDRNGIQNDRWTHEAMNLEPLPDKWRAFGWDVHEVDGHDLGEMVGALSSASERDGKRHAIIAKTVKGKGVSFMGEQPRFSRKGAQRRRTEAGVRGDRLERWLRRSPPVRRLERPC